MSTLTANEIRRPEHCCHKLPTSCRLTSIPNCCACADERAHAASYSTYIDGVGFVSRGNRWQRYCWYCKIFWENRVQVSGLRIGQTRVPEVPDQKEFLERWYEFHRGYRIVRGSNGEEERVSVLGEDFKDVTPGCLPRTLEELRAGRGLQEVQQQAQQIADETEEDTGPSLEETLDQMFADAATEDRRHSTTMSTTPSQSLQEPNESRDPRTNIHAQAMVPAASRNREYQVRRVAALRRELDRMRNGIERVITGLRDLGEDVPDDLDSSGAIRGLDAILQTSSRESAESRASDLNTVSDRNTAGLETRLQAARSAFNEAHRRRDLAIAESRAAEEEFASSQRRLQQLQREQRTMENYTRVFGTREEMLAQGDNYESPIRSMFSRATERFRAAEDVRREQRTLRQVLEDEARIDTTEAMARRLEELEHRERDVWGVPRQADVPTSQQRVPDDQSQHARPLDFQPPAIDETGGNGRAMLPSALGEGILEERSNEEIDTPPILSNTSDETMLQEYYAMMREEDRSLQNIEQRSAPGESQRGDVTNEFPRNMLNAIVAARARELEERNQQEDSGVIGEPAIDDTPRSYFSEDEWWHQDAEIIIRALTTNESLREELSFSTQDAAVLLAYFIDDIVSESDRTTIDGLLRNPVAIWWTGLPAEWLSRRKELILDGVIVPPGLFLGDGGSGGSVAWAMHHNPYMLTELTAQAFMMSAEVRRKAPSLTPPEKLQMLYRLQAGRRTDQDVMVLERMTADTEISSLAEDVYSRNLFGDVEPQVEHVNARRREMLRSGNYSRQELDARRRETSTRAFALAAGRQAMQTGSQALIEQAASANAAAENDNEEAGTRAAYHRLQASGLPGPLRRDRFERRTTLYRQLTLSDYVTSSPGSSRSSSPEPARGLDAQDSGRPAPKSDEELFVALGCQICYTQMADVACLPCGHLVMCRWCSEQHSPCLTHDRTRPRRPAGCPVCRKGIRQKVRVFRA